MKLFGLSMTAMLLFACGEKEETTEPSTEPAGEPSEEVTDADEDGVPAEDDCDDSDADLGAVAEDGDCDGILTADDCDDEDDSSNAIADDADCDGVLTADDCDDADATSTVVAEDADCDGTLTADDCDDDNAGSTIVAEDGDCDGVPTEEDCDDADENSTIQATDEDCDGVETADDCDDTDSSSTAVAEDADCDGILTADDCDDTDSASTIVADDGDCDTVLTADDCDDTDASSTTIAEDADCDTVLTADDCDDTDSSSTTVATDGDCDGTLAADDCNDGDSSSTIVADDGDCDGVLTADDCDDTDSSSTTVATDADCDGTLTADDCDDTDASSTIVATDGDCDGHLTADDCDDTNAAINTAATEIWYNGDDDDCSGNASDYDQDGDGEDAVAHGGADCNDTDATALNNTYYIDADADSYGDSSTSVTDCTLPSGYADNDLDCNDDPNNGGAAINPAATEVCDEIDNDCNGDTDDDDSGLDAATGETFYLDSDGDQEGDPNNFVMQCEMPSTHVDNDQDCDDTDSSLNNFNPDNDLFSSCDGDCDDSDVNVFPGATEIWYDGTDQDCSGGSDFDQDGDGEDSDAHGGTDCNDTDGAINTAATEIWYDGDDQDCDGLSDYDQDMDGEDAVAHGGSDCDDTDANIIVNTYYIDDDADGYGDSSTSTTDCTLPSGYADNDLDCNDDPASGGTGINPAATEICDEIDNDCNGDIDDDDSNLDTSSATIWYADLDEDGHGDPNNSVMTCEMPSTHVDTNGDCDDTDEFTFPQGSELFGTACITDADQDGYGDANATGDVIAGTDCDDSDPNISPVVATDGTNVVDGIDNDCDGIADEDSFFDISVLVAGDLIITEIMPDPTAVSDANGEWFEIYNDTGVGLNLDGLGFMDDGSDDFTVSGDLYLPADEYLVLGKSADTSTNGGLDVDYEYGSGMGLTNTSDEIHIYTPSDFIDSVAWDNGATFPDQAGATIALDPGTSAADNDSGFSWCEGTSTYGEGDLGTPGVENDACPPPLTWSADIQPILQSYSCTGCHSSRMPDLSTILTIQAGDRSGSNSGANMPWITAGDPSQSYLLHKVMGTQGSVGGGGGTMPQGGSMSQSDIDSLELWINQGAN